MMTPAEAVQATYEARGYRLYHDTDIDRTALHARYAAWCESEEGERVKVLGKDSYTVTGVPTPAGPIDVHSIVAVIEVGDGPSSEAIVALQTQLRRTEDVVERLRRAIGQASRTLARAE